MSKKKAALPNATEKPRVHKDLVNENGSNETDGKINSFGEINSTIDIDKINLFLNKHVDDKKLRDRDESEEE